MECCLGRLCWLPGKSSCPQEGGCLPACLPGNCYLPEKAFPGESAIRGNCASFLGSSTVPGKGGCLPAWVEMKLLPAWELLPCWGRPSLERVLLGGTAPGLLGSSAVPGKGLNACLPACEELALSLLDCEVFQVIFPSFLHTKLLNLFTCF